MSEIEPVNAIMEIHEAQQEICGAEQPVEPHEMYQAQQEICVAIEPGESLENYEAHLAIHEDKQPRKQRVLLAVSGSVAAIKCDHLYRSFAEWAEVKVVATKSSLHFLSMLDLPEDVILYTDDDDWSSWKKIGDGVLHIELRKWADTMVIAPLSANTLAKIAGGFCNNLLTCIVRAWDYNKPLFVAPAMNTLMWNNPFTKRHIDSINELGIHVIPPIIKRLACGDFGTGAMAEATFIHDTVAFSIEHPHVL